MALKFIMAVINIFNSKNNFLVHFYQKKYNKMRCIAQILSINKISQNWSSIDFIYKYTNGQPKITYCINWNYLR